MTFFLFEGMDVDASCILVLLQCQDFEWFGDEAWAWEAAQRCIGRGFGILRVPTQNWADVKRQHPEWFSPGFEENECEQQVICTVNFIHVLCPMLQEVHHVLQSCDDEDCVGHCRRHGFIIYVPEGVQRVSTDLYVVCEAPSNIAANLSPPGLRLIYGWYSQPVLWCGFNMKARIGGSRGVIGDAASLMVLGASLQRLSLYHIDQTYKALCSPFFGAVERNHICFGFLPHRSQCCNSSRGDLMPMSTDSYTPHPVIPESLLFREKKSFTVEEALLGALVVSTRVRGPQDVTDVVCLRLQSYMCKDDPIFSADNYSVLRRLEVVRRSLKIAKTAHDSRSLQLLEEC